jgi:hypothetical protein
MSARRLAVQPFILLWAIWGAIVDWRYKRDGGMRPTRKDRIFFSVAVALCFAMFASLAMMRSGVALAHPTELLLSILFGLWELDRWRILAVIP